MNRLLRMGCACFLVCVLCVCGSRTKESTVAVIPKGTTLVYWKGVEAGAAQASKDLGIKILWIGTEKEDDRQQQIALVDNQVMNGISGIVLAPCDGAALLRPVEAAARKNIPVIIMDSDLYDSDRITVSFVATDNEESGRLAAREMARMLQSRGKLVVLRWQENSASTENRAKGFLDEVKKYPGLEVVSGDQYGGATETQTQQASENLLFRFRTENGTLAVQGIFCVNEGTTYGMLQALRRQRLAGKVKFIGFDSSEPFLDALKSGEMDGLIVQNPYKIGYLGVSTMVRHLKGESVPKRIDTGVTFVTPSDLKKPEIQQLLHPVSKP